MALMVRSEVDVQISYHGISPSIVSENGLLSIGNVDP